MKIGILADSHDHLHYLERAVTLLRQRQVEFVLHAGDFVAPFTIPLLGQAGCPVFAVFGNNDGERVGLHMRLGQIGAEVHERPWTYHFRELRILLAHEPVALDSLSGSSDFDLVVYGHTHEVDVRCPPQGALLVNPGEVCGWLSGKPTCAVVSLGERRVEILDLKQQD